MVVRRLPADSELYHHGIMGMRWGVRRYQNKDGSLTNAGRKHRGLIEQIRYNRKMKKVRKARVEKAKAQQKAKEEQVKRLQQANEERRQRAEVIKTGSAKDIQKFQHKMSAKEYEEALSRINFKQRLDEAAASQAEEKGRKLVSKLNTISNVANTVSNVANNAANVYDALTRVGVIKKKETAPVKTKLQKLQDERDILSVTMDIADLKYEKENLSKQRKELKKLQNEEKRKLAKSNATKYDRVINGEDKSTVSDEQYRQMQERIKELERRLG